MDGRVGLAPSSCPAGPQPGMAMAMARSETLSGAERGKTTLADPATPADS